MPRPQQRTPFAFTKSIGWLRTAATWSRTQNGGTANIQFLPGDESELFVSSEGYYGYVQVAVSPGAGGPYGWAVQNKLVVIPTTEDFDGRFPDTMAFNLLVRRGLHISSNLGYRAAVVITSAPLTSAPIVPLYLNQYSVPVGAEDWIWGNGPPTGINTPPQAQNYVAVADEQKDERFTSKIKIKEEDVEAVDEELNGCGPGATARSIKYLQKQGLINVNQNVQQVYTTLKGKDCMDTKIGAGQAGTTNANFEKGKKRYSDGRRLNITTEATATTPFVKSDVMDPMNNGADVEIVFYKGKNEKGEDLDGHIAFVSEIILTRDKKTEDVTGMQVKIIDDPVQGDDKAANRTLWLNFKGKEAKLDGWGMGAELTQFFVESVPKK